MKHNLVQELDKKLSEVLLSGTNLKQMLLDLSSLYVQLLKCIYDTQDVNILIGRFLEDVVRSREFVLATYLTVALLFVKDPSLVEYLPDEVAKLYLSQLLVLYEKTKHICNLLT